MRPRPLVFTRKEILCNPDYIINNEKSKIIGIQDLLSKFQCIYGGLFRNTEYGRSFSSF